MDSYIQRIQVALQVFSRNMEQDIAERIKAPITKPQILLLYTINTFEKCRLSQLADKMEVKPSAITVMIDRLERENFVKRIHDPEDRRAVIVTLTKLGEEVLEQVIRDWNDVVKQYLKQFNSEEIQALTKLIEKLAGLETNQNEQAVVSTRRHVPKLER